MHKMPEAMHKPEANEIEQYKAKQKSPPMTSKKKHLKSQKNILKPRFQLQKALAS